MQKYGVVAETKNVSDGKKAVGNVLDGFKILLQTERKTPELPAKADDDGTNALMSDYMREQEKSGWVTRLI